MNNDKTISILSVLKEIRMKQFQYIFIMTLFIGCLFIELPAQGITRPMGIGLRGGFMKSKDPVSTIAEGPLTANVISGAGGGGMLYFFSRIQPRWYLEAAVGEIGARNFVAAGPNGSWVGESKINPYLFGARYDLLDTDKASILQPYISSGTGLYSIIQNNVVSNTPGGSAVVSNDSELNLGLYFGGGTNIILASWFTLNLDLKYHLIDMKFNAGYSGPEYTFGLSFMWGRLPEIFRIEDVTVIVHDVYPAFYQFYSTYPLALVKVKNMASQPIEVNLYSKIESFSDQMHETGFVKFNAGEVKDLPVYAFFGPQLIYTTQREPAVLDIELEARAGVTHTTTHKVNITIHSRNAWNGEMDRLVFFVTPDQEKVMEFSRKISATVSGDLKPEIKNFELARRIFNKLGNDGIRYQTDPNIPFYRDDYVQYAVETLEKKAGDCDDLVILYASLLESIGINTAFVEVRDPNQPQAHLYLLFDSGVKPENSSLISSNEKRFIVREGLNQHKTLWIPVETTLVERAFEKAWEAGATHYLQEAVVRSGLNQGWVNIIDIN
jgi:hypothetical protein